VMEEKTKDVLVMFLIVFIGLLVYDTIRGK
jgi:hypothetical protein